MAAFLTALILIVVMGGLLAIPVIARARPHSRVAQAIRGAGGRYNELYLAGHEADDEAPEWAVATGPLDDDPDGASEVDPSPGDIGDMDDTDTDRDGHAVGSGPADRAAGSSLDRPGGRP